MSNQSLGTSIYGINQVFLLSYSLGSPAFYNHLVLWEFQFCCFCLTILNSNRFGPGSTYWTNNYLTQNTCVRACAMEVSFQSKWYRNVPVCMRAKPTRKTYRFGKHYFWNSQKCTRKNEGETKPSIIWLCHSFISYAILQLILRPAFYLLIYLTSLYFLVVTAAHKSAKTGA